VDIDGGGPGVDRRRRAAFDRRADRQPHPAEADDRTHEREFREGLETVEENVAAEAQRVEPVRGGAESGTAVVGVGDRGDRGRIYERDPRLLRVEHPLVRARQPSREATLRGYALGEEARRGGPRLPIVGGERRRLPCRVRQDRKSTRLNSSHVSISYAVFCLKKKNKNA